MNALMIVDSDALARARRGSQPAILQVLEAQYPECYRIACAIGGSADAAAAIVADVMRRSLHMIDSWRDEQAPQRWFRHHTLLALRSLPRKSPRSRDDMLLRGDCDGAFIAFVRALRGLSPQQIEAFLLANAEGLNVRAIAVAMDCSTTAAQMHLREGEQRLRQLAGEQYVHLVERLRAAYQNLTPPKELSIGRVQKELHAYFRVRRLARLARGLGLVALLLLAIWLVWRLFPQIALILRQMFGGFFEK